MFIIHITYEVKEGKQQAFLDRLNELEVSLKSKQEEGNLDYTYYLPTDGSGNLFLVEVWESVAAQEAHTHTPHFQALKAIQKDYIDGVKIQLYDGAHAMAPR